MSDADKPTSASPEAEKAGQVGTTRSDSLAKQPPSDGGDSSSAARADKGEENGQRGSVRQEGDAQNPSGSQTADLDAARAAADVHAPSAYVRHETFLARLPRWKKLGATALLLFLCSLPFLLPGTAPRQEKGVASTEGPEATRTLATDKKERKTSKESTPSSSPLEKAAAPALKEPASSAEAEAIAHNDAYDRAPLSLAPDPALVEQSASGDLPRIATDGRRPMRVYARPFNQADPRPRIAIVIVGLGFSRVATDATLLHMPPPVTLAFDVQSDAVSDWLQRARQDGHETLLDLPLEPFDYPDNDPGPNTLLTTLPDRENLDRLLWCLSRGTGYVGVTSESGSRFAAAPEKVRLFLSVLRDRGLLLLDTRITPHSVLNELADPAHLAVLSSSRRIDDTPSPEAIDAALVDLEHTARLEGAAIGVASALPLSLERIEAWSKTLAQKGIALAPLSALTAPHKH